MTRQPRNRAESRFRGRRSCRAALLTGWALAALGCSEERPANLLFIVADTLRADALECPGGAERTPNLCALAARGTLFERATSTASWTLPSSASLMTGNYPRAYAYPDAEGRIGDIYHVHDDEVLLAETLRTRGYDVNAFVENQMALRANALQGFSFENFEDVTLHPEVRAALKEAVGLEARDVRYQNTINALYFLLEINRKPFYILQWFMDPHSVYRPPESVVGDVEVDLSRLTHPPDYYVTLGTPGTGTRNVHDLRVVGPTLDAYERNLLRRLYDKEVETVDERVGALLKALDVRHIRDETFVVFTSDHGEEFGEHGSFLHRNSLHGELVNVPLIIAGPGISVQRRIEAPVSLVDLAPTLHELMGLGRLAGVQGRSFAGLLTGSATAERRTPYMVDALHDGDWDALVEGDFKLVVREGRAPQLFDVRADPLEQSDIAARLPGVVSSMLEKMTSLRRNNDTRRMRNASALSDAKLREIRAETAEQLRAMGYVAPD